MHDAIALERLGIPSACVITDGFLPTARAMAELAGLPDYPLVVIAHPISDNTADQLRSKAEAIAEQAVALLLQPTCAESTAALAFPPTAVEPAAARDLPRASAEPAPGGLDALRELLRADGADVEFLGYDDGTAHLRLVLAPGCDECVMPRTYLEPMLLRHLQPSLPEVQRVLLDDPRERA